MTKKFDEQMKSMNFDELEEASEGLRLQKPKTLQAKMKESLDNFSELLDKLAGTEDRRKALWKDIYENAITDRMNAYLLFSDLYKHVNGNPTEHALHGANLAKYLERMSKSNEQIIKLADLVSQEIEAEEETDFSEDNLYSQIGNLKSATKGKH